MTSEQERKQANEILRKAFVYFSGGNLQPDKDMIAFIKEHRDAIAIKPGCKHQPIVPRTICDQFVKKANPDPLFERAKRNFLT